MPMSASCRRDRAPARGFSLLELLIVLVLTSMTVALVAPRLTKTIDAIAGSGERAEVQRQIESLPLEARRKSVPVVVPAQGELGSTVDLPDGWKVVALAPLRVEANGVCTGTILKVEGLGSAEEWRVSAPDCTVDHGVR